LQNRKAAIEREQQTQDGKTDEGDARTKLLTQYEHIGELTHDTVREFVKSINISKKNDNEREIKIVWNV